MEINRKAFLKFSGVAALFGIGGPAAVRFAAQLEATPPQAENKQSVKTKRLGMLVDMRKCKEDCNECLDACHSIHNVPDFNNPKDEIKWIWKEPAKHLFPDVAYKYKNSSDANEPILTLCNHCDNPPCVRVCPTGATWKREEDGIVMMDFHRCIGCRFCMAGCPYGSRSFNYRNPRTHIKKINKQFPTRTKGVVEKCSFCAERLADKLQPACVAACKEGVLTFGDLNDANSKLSKLIRKEKTMSRKAELGTRPSVFYIL